MANRIRGITVEIGGDTTKLEASLKSVNSTIRTTQTELRDVNKLLKLDPSNTELLSQKQRALKDAIGATKEKLDALKTAQAQAKQQLEEGTLGQDKYDALQREIVATEQELKRLQQEALNTNQKLEKIDEVGRKMESAGESISGVGRKMMPATIAIAGVGTAAVKTAADFDTQMSKVSAISGATGNDFQKLRDKAREMGEKTKFSASEAGSAFEYMAMAGWKTNDMLDGIEGVMNLAAASGEDLATTSDIVTDALTAFGLTAKDSGHFADILAAASSNANTNVSMMGETFKYCAPIAGALGFSAEDTAEAIGLMANAGIKSSQAGTSLRTIMNNLSSPIKLAGKELGEVTIQTTNADGSMRGLSDILADCREAFSHMSESEKANAAETLVGKNAMSGFLALMNAGQGDIDKLSSAIDNCDGTSERMAETMQDNLSGQLTILKSQLEELAISFGDLLMPAIRGMVSKVQDFVDKLNGMDDATRKNVLRIGLLVAALAPFLIVLGTTIQKMGIAMQGFVGLAKHVKKLQMVVGDANGLFGKLSASLGGISIPVMAAVAVIAVLAGAFVHLWKTNEEFRDNILTIWERVKSAFSDFGDAIASRLEALGISFSDITSAIKTVWDGFCQLLAPVFEGAFSIIASVLETVLDVLVGLLDVFIGTFTGDWGQAWRGVKEIFAGVWDGIKGVLSAAFTAIKDLTNVMLGWFGTNWKTVWNAIKTFFSEIWNAMKTTVTTVMNAIKAVIQTGWSAVKATITTVMNAIKSVISTIWNAIKSAISTVVNAIKSNVTGTWNTIKSTITSIMNGMKSTITGVWNAIKSSVSSTVNGMKSSLSGAFNAIKNTASTVWNAIKSAITRPIKEAKEKVSDMIDAMKRKFHFQWSLPHIDLPHFRISGYFSLDPPSVPSFSIRWYKKAMDGGMILNTPTIFGMQGNSLLGAGEAGSETVVGTQSLMDMIQRAVDGMNQAMNVNYGGVTINVYSQPGQDISSLADEIEERINLNVARKNAAFA